MTGDQAATLSKITSIIDEHGFAPLACSSCKQVTESRDATVLVSFKQYARGGVMAGGGPSVRCGACGASGSMTQWISSTVEVLSGI